MRKRLVTTVKGAVLALILTVMFSLLLAAAMYFFDISDGAVSILIFLIAAISCTAGAYTACSALGSKGLATGAALGLIYYITLSLASLLIKKELSLDTHTLIMLAATTVSGMLGGVLAMPR